MYITSKIVFGTLRHIARLSISAEQTYSQDRFPEMHRVSEIERVRNRLVLVVRWRLACFPNGIVCETCSFVACTSLGDVSRQSCPDKFDRLLIDVLPTKRHASAA